VNFSTASLNEYCATPYHCHISIGGGEPSRGDYFLAQSLNEAHTVMTVATSTGGVPGAFTGGVVWACIPGANPLASGQNITVRYNQLSHTSRGFNMTTYLSQCKDEAGVLENFSFHDNTVDDLDGWEWNIQAGACCAWGSGLGIGNVYSEQSKAAQNI